MTLEGASMTLSMKHLGCTKEEVEAIIQEDRKDLDDLGKHVYGRM